MAEGGSPPSKQTPTMWVIHIYFNQSMIACLVVCAILIVAGGDQGNDNESSEAPTLLAGAQEPMDVRDSRNVSDVTGRDESAGAGACASTAASACCLGPCQYIQNPVLA